MITRHIMPVIENTIKSFPVLLLSGPRQVGKSTLLYNNLLSQGYSYVSFDDKLELLLAKNDPRSFLDAHNAPLIIDEAQYAPELFPEIERRVNISRLERGDRESNGMYILSGSQRKRLLDEAKESLAGRVAILDMTALSLNEIFSLDSVPFSVDTSSCLLRSKRKTYSENEVFQLIHRGFFPSLYGDPEMNVPIFYSSYLQTYMQKDLKEILDVSDEFKFLSFLRLLASNTGQELVYESYAKEVGVRLNTIKSWIAALRKTEIIFLLEPYNEESIVKRVVKRPKVYFFDTGLAAYLSGIDSPETLSKSFLKGRFFETFVINEIRKTYINAGLSQELYYYRDNNQNEIDLVLLRDGTLSCIEIKSGQSFSSSVNKGFRQLSGTKYIKGKNAIISTASLFSMLDENTLILPISAI